MIDIHALVEKQRNYFLSGVTLPLETRIENLKKKMAEIMQSLRENPPTALGGLKVVKISDYQNSTVKDLKRIIK